MTLDLEWKIKDLSGTLGEKITMHSHLYQDTVVTSVRIDGIDKGCFSLTPLPGNQQIVVSHDVYLSRDVRGQGYGKLLHDFRIRVCRECGVKTMMATVNNNNMVELSILQSRNWFLMPLTETATMATLRLEEG